MTHNLALTESRFRWPAPPYGALAMAIVATRAGFWSKAVCAWQDQYVSGRYRELAAFCAAEAALHIGRYGVADYMLVHCGECAMKLAELEALSQPVRSARKRWFAERTGAEPRPADLEKLIELKLYNDALQLITRQRLFGEEYLEQCVEILQARGEHDAVCAIAADVSFSSATAEELAETIALSEQQNAIWQQPPAESINWFHNHHPASYFLPDEVFTPGRP